jgi:hypothetical protein
MTTITAVSQHEIIVNNNGRAVRVSVAKLMAVDEQVAASTRFAIANIGTEVKVAGRTDRKPRHAVMHGLLQ